MSLGEGEQAPTAEPADEVARETSGVDAPAPKTKSSRIKLHPAVALLCVLIFVPSLWMASIRGGDVGNNLIAAFVGPLMVNFLGLILGVIAFYAFRRSTKAFNLTMTTVLAAFVLFTGSMILQRTAKPSAAEVQAFEAARKVQVQFLKEVRLHSVPGPGPLDSTEVEKYLTALDAAADAVGGGMGDAMKAATSLRREICTASATASLSYAEYTKAGAITLGKFKRKSDVESRLALTLKAEDDNRVLLRTLNTADQRYAQAIKGVRLASSDRDFAVDEFRQGADLNALSELSQHRSRHLEGARTFLTILSENWEHYDPNNDALLAIDDQAKLKDMHRSINNAIAGYEDEKAWADEYIRGKRTKVRPTLPGPVSTPSSAD